MAFSYKGEEFDDKDMDELRELLKYEGLLDQPNWSYDHRVKKLERVRCLTDVLTTNNSHTNGDVMVRWEIDMAVANHLQVLSVKGPSVDAVEEVPNVRPSFTTDLGHIEVKEEVGSGLYGKVYKSNSCLPVYGRFVEN